MEESASSFSIPDSRFPIPDPGVPCVHPSAGVSFVAFRFFGLRLGRGGGGNPRPAPATVTGDVPGTNHWARVDREVRSRVREGARRRRIRKPGDLPDETLPRTGGSG